MLFRPQVVIKVKNRYHDAKEAAMHPTTKAGRTDRIVSFYLHGFRSMRLGRTLWKIVFIKLFILFAVLKLFFFPDFLETNFNSDAERAEYVLENLTAAPSGSSRPTVHNETVQRPVP